MFKVRVIRNHSAYKGIQKGLEFDVRQEDKGTVYHQYLVGHTWVDAKYFEKIGETVVSCTFKVGDKVKCVNFDGLTEREVAYLKDKTVTIITLPQAPSECITINAEGEHYFHWRFQLVEEKQMNINYHVLGNSMVLNFSGQTYTIAKSDVRYAPVLAAIKAGKLSDIPDLVDVKKAYSVSGLVLKDNLLFLDNEALPEALSERVLAFQKEQLPFEHLVKFARKLRKNPSFNSREQLFKFLEHNGHPITTEGNFIAYRGIRDDFKDMHTGKFDNSPGQVCEMKREDVDDNPNNTCSRGLHVACYDYAKGFGQKLVEVEVDPQDVVCVPTDYNGTKMRTCKFKVVVEASRMNDKQLVNSSYAPEVDEDDNTEDECNDCDDSCGDNDSDLYQLQLAKSSLIASAEYNESSEDLTVNFTNGASYEYYNVPYGTIADWERAKSVGAYYNTHIAHSFTYSEL